jgi:maltooligosyltrehalose trehalohydrolase
MVRRDRRTWLAFSFSERVEEVTAPLPPGKWKLALSSSAPEWDGPGNTLPERLESTGDVVLKLQPSSFCVYVASRDP